MSKYRKPTNNQSMSDKRHTNNKSDVVCKACSGIGHCITNPDSICYNLAKAHPCANFLAKESNLPAIKSNTYKYKKDRKERAKRNKVSTKMDTFIKKLEENGSGGQDMTPIIHMAQAIATHSDYNSDTDGSDEDSDQSQE